MKRYQFSLLYSIICKSFSKWIRLKEVQTPGEMLLALMETLDKGEQGMWNLLGLFRSVQIISK